MATTEGALTLRVEPETARVAEPLALTIESDAPGVTWPDWAAALPGWDVVPQTVTDQSATLTLRSWLPGDIAVPPITATTPGGVTYTSEPQTVTVTSVLPEDADVADAGALREAAGALPLAEAGTSRQVRLATGVLGALVLGGGYLLLRRVAGPRHDPEGEIDAMVSEAAQHRDVALASAAVRQSVELHFGIEATRLTTAELGHDERLVRRLGEPLREKLVGLMQRIDGVRYAGSGDEPWATATDAGEVIRELRAAAARERSKGRDA